MDTIIQVLMPSSIEIPQTMRNSSLPVRPDTPGGPPNVTVVEISDPTAAGEALEVIDQNAVQLESKPFRARRVIVRLGPNMVLFTSTNRPVRTRTRLQDGLVAHVAFGPRAVGTVNGLPVGPERVLIVTQPIEVEFIVAAGYESITFFVPSDDIRTHLRGRYREDEFRLSRAVELLTPNPSAVHALYRWGRRLVDIAAKQPEVFDMPQTQSAAQVELIENLLATLRSTVQVEATRHDLTRQAYSRVVQITEDYALSHVSERIYVTDLCEAAGVSERTLQYAFKVLVGMTPVAYLTRLRLHKVRQALRTATPASTTVTKEALRWGFWHFGDFSRSYKECFGEMPSQTLRRPPEMGKPV